MPKLLNVDFSAITSVNSVSATTIGNLDNVTYNDNGVNLLVGGRFKGYDDYDNSIVKVFANGTKDESFNSGDGFLTKFNNIGFSSPLILAIEIDSNGDYYVGGEFNIYNGFTTRNIVKILKTGEVDTSFNCQPGFSIPFGIPTVRSIKIQSDGKILVGGNFSQYKGITVNGIVRLNTDGSIDNTFSSPSLPLNGVYTIVFDSFDNIYVGGDFNSYSGFSAQRIVKLTPSGSVDQSFNLNNGFNGVVSKIVVDSSDNLYVVGFFTTYSGVSENRIIKLLNNGQKDTSFDNTTGFNGNVNDIVIDSFGKLYVVGLFTQYKGANNTRIIKLNTDGTRDATFATNRFSTNNATEMNSIHIDASSNIYIGGRFTTYNLFFQNSIIKVNSLGDLDLSFNSFGTIGPNQSVYVIKTDSNGDLIIGGIFNSYKQPLGFTSIKTYNAKLNTQFNPNYGVNVSVSVGGINVSALGKSPTTNNIYVGGFFENYTLLNSNYRAIAILGLNPDGSPNPSINVNAGANSTIQSMFIDSAGGIYLTGGFTAYKGVGVPRFVKINPDSSIDNSFNRSGLQNGSLYATADFDSSNNIYLGGFFTTFSGQTNNRIIKLLPTGFKDNTFDNSIGFNDAVRGLKVDSYGKILVVGNFTQYKGISANRIIRLNSDGSIDNTFDNSIGFNNAPFWVGFWGDKIYVSGFFTSYKNKPYIGLIRLNYDGSIDSTFRPKSGFNFAPNLLDMLVDNDGSVYLFGTTINYQKYGDASVVKIKPDGSRDVLFNVTLANFKDYGTGFGFSINKGILI
jgi:uncharacterized delta-60 repeat protein